MNNAQPQGLSLKEQLLKELQSPLITKPFKSYNYRGTVDVLQMEVVMFFTWGKFILEGEKSKDPEINTLAGKLRKKVVELQQKEFPSMRANYAEIVKETMRIHSVHVKTMEEDHSVLHLESPFFAVKKNINDYQKQLADIVQQFRFKRVVYGNGHRGNGQQQSVLHQGSPPDSAIIRFLT